MFIVTMVFLIALIFSVQQLLLQYAAIDPSAPPQTTDAYLVENMEPIFQAALDSSDDCEEARANVRELKNLITRTIKGGYSVDISGDIACSPSGEWPSAPELTILVIVTGETSETKAEFELYWGGPGPSPPPPPGTLVYIQPDEQTVGLGSPVQVDVSISDVQDLYGFQFDLTYDPGVLQFQSITEGPFLSSDGNSTFWWNDTGDDTTYSINNTACVRWGPVGGIDGDGVLATVTFTTAGTDTSPITLENVILTDPDGNPITPFNIDNGEVTVT